MKYFFNKYKLIHFPPSSPVFTTMSRSWKDRMSAENVRRMALLAAQKTNFETTKKHVTESMDKISSHVNKLNTMADFINVHLGCVDEDQVDRVMGEFTPKDKFPTVPTTIRPRVRVGGSAGASPGAGARRSPIPKSPSPTNTLERRLQDLRANFIRDTDHKMTIEKEEDFTFEMIDSFELYLLNIKEMGELWNTGIALKYLIKTFPRVRKFDDYYKCFESSFKEKYEDWLPCFKDDKTLPNEEQLVSLFCEFDEDTLCSIGFYKLYSSFDNATLVEYVDHHVLAKGRSIESPLIFYYIIKNKFDDSNSNKRTLSNLKELLKYLI